MGNFTFEEINLICIYNTGSRTGLIEALTEMCGELAPEDLEQIRYWNPQTVGEIVFNTWD